MKTVVYSTDANGRRRWVANFAHEATARDFRDWFNRRYEGHLTASLEETQP